MKNNKVLNTIKVVLFAVYIAKTTSYMIKNGVNNSEKIQNFNKEFKLRRDGVKTVKYKNV